jgi:hypothetical protein
VFVRMHLLSSALAVAALWHHHRAADLDVVAPYYLLLLLDYAVRAVQALWRRPRVLSAEPLVAEAAAAHGGAAQPALAVTLRVRLRRSARAAPNGVCTAGQYYFLCVPAVSWFQWHPFSVVRADTYTEDEPANGTDNARNQRGWAEATFTIAARGAWTQAVVSSAAKQLAPCGASGLGARVWLDGQYGSLSIDPMHYRWCVAVCGGIGLTPFLSVLTERCQERPCHVWLVWCVRQPAIRRHFEPALRRLATLGVTVRLHLTGSAAAAAAEATEEQLPLPSPSPPASCAAAAEDDGGGASLTVHRGRPSGELRYASLTVHRGRPSLSALFAEVAAHYTAQCMGSDRGHGRGAVHHGGGGAGCGAAGSRGAVAVLCCGPAELVGATQRACAWATTAPPQRGAASFDVHSEVFAW